MKRAKEASLPSATGPHTEPGTFCAQPGVPLTTSTTCKPRLEACRSSCSSLEIAFQLRYISLGSTADQGSELRRTQ